MDINQFNQGAGSTGTTTQQARDVIQAMLRGAWQTCPSCGEGALYWRYLKVRDQCPRCGEELYHHRADDAPPYVTILIVAHVIVGLLLATEEAFHPSEWIHAVMWLPLTLLMSLYLLPRIKGAIIGMQWALRMHGFGDGAKSARPSPQVDGQ
jgi:uncharacterized protein (DUF983 family)